MIVLGSFKARDKVFCFLERVYLGNMHWSPGIPGQCPESFKALQVLP